MSKDNLFDTYVKVLSTHKWSLTQQYIIRLMGSHHLQMEVPKISSLPNGAKLWFCSQTDCNTFISKVPVKSFGAAARYEVPVVAFNFVIKNILIRNSFNDVRNFLLVKMRCEKVMGLEKRHILASSRNPNLVNRLLASGIHFKSCWFSVQIHCEFRPCTKCNNYGHVFLQCRNLLPQCSVCGEFTQTEFCDHPKLKNQKLRKYCSTCYGNNHSTGDKWCPRYPKYFQLMPTLIHVIPDWLSLGKGMKRKEDNVSSSPAKKASIGASHTITSSAVKSSHQPQCKVIAVSETPKGQNKSVGFNASFASELCLEGSPDGSKSTSSEMCVPVYPPKDQTSLTEEDNQCEKEKKKTSQISSETNIVQVISKHVHDEIEISDSSGQKLCEESDVAGKPVANYFINLLFVILNHTFKYFEEKDMSKSNQIAYNNMKDLYLAITNSSLSYILNYDLYKEIPSSSILQEVCIGCNKLSEILRDGHTGDKKMSICAGMKSDSVNKDLLQENQKECYKDVDVLQGVVKIDKGTLTDINPITDSYTQTTVKVVKNRDMQTDEEVSSRTETRDVSTQIEDDFMDAQIGVKTDKCTLTDMNQVLVSDACTQVIIPLKDIDVQTDDKIDSRTETKNVSTVIEDDFMGLQPGEKADKCTLTDMDQVLVSDACTQVIIPLKHIDVQTDDKIDSRTEAKDVSEASTESETDCIEMFPNTAQESNDFVDTCTTENKSIVNGTRFPRKAKDGCRYKETVSRYRKNKKKSSRKNSRSGTEELTGTEKNVCAPENSSKGRKKGIGKKTSVRLPEQVIDNELMPVLQPQVDNTNVHDTGAHCSHSRSAGEHSAKSSKEDLASQTAAKEQREVPSTTLDCKPSTSGYNTGERDQESSYQEIAIMLRYGPRYHRILNNTVSKKLKVWTRALSTFIIDILAEASLEFNNNDPEGIVHSTMIKRFEDLKQSLLETITSELQTEQIEDSDSSSD